MNKEELDKRKEKLYEDYQNARVEGFIPAEWEFEDYMIYLHDIIVAEWNWAARELREWELKDHPQYRGNKR